MCERFMHENCICEYLSHLNSDLIILTLGVYVLYHSYTSEYMCLNDISIIMYICLSALLYQNQDQFSKCIAKAMGKSEPMNSKLR